MNLQTIFLSLEIFVLFLPFLITSFPLYDQEGKITIQIKEKNNVFRQSKIQHLTKF